MKVCSLGDKVDGSKWPSGMSFQWSGSCNNSVYISASLASCYMGNPNFIKEWGKSACRKGSCFIFHSPPPQCLRGHVQLELKEECSASRTHCSYSLFFSHSWVLYIAYNPWFLFVGTSGFRNLSSKYIGIFESATSCTLLAEMSSLEQACWVSWGPSKP